MTPEEMDTFILQMNNCSLIGLLIPERQTIIDDAYDMMHKNTDGHKHIKQHEYGVLDKGVICQLIMAELHDKVTGKL